MRIETHHIFKVSVFATQVKIKFVLLKIIFPNYYIKVFFTYNIIIFKFIVPLFEYIESTR